ncbi:MAG: sigma-70 family RNA polymerase sigma factor [Litorilinea sp.]
MQSEQELIHACGQGDELAWQTLVTRYERLVYSIPLNYGLSAADAADIAQLTFTYLLESIRDLRPDSNLGGWLATVARRQTWRMVQRRRREVPHEDLDTTLAPPSATGAAAAAGPEANLMWRSTVDWQTRWEQMEWIQSGMVHLQARCRDLLTLLYFDPDEPSYDQIAAQLAIKVGSIGPTRARCLEKLREFLQR